MSERGAKLFPARREKTAGVFTPWMDKPLSCNVPPMPLPIGIRKRIARTNQAIRAHKEYLKQMELSLAALKAIAEDAKLKKRLIR